jgi:Zn-dependent protease with chaperone function
MADLADLATRKKVHFSRLEAMLPDILAEHAPHAFRSISAEHHQPILDDYKRALLEQAPQTMAALNDSQLAELEGKFASGQLRKDFSRGIKDDLHSIVLHHRIGEPLAESCEQMGVAMPILRGSDYLPLPGKSKPMNNRSLPITVAPWSDGTHALTVHPELTNMLDNDELHAISVHEVAHIARGDTNRAGRPGKIFISREAEFAADEMAARVTGKPHALIGALRKLEIYSKNQTDAVIEQVMSKGPYGWIKKISPKVHTAATEILKSSTSRKLMEAPAKLLMRIKHGGEHPTMDERIERLESIAQELGAKAVAWHPADESAKVWTQTLEQGIEKAAREIGRHPRL